MNESKKNCFLAASASPRSVEIDERHNVFEHCERAFLSRESDRLINNRVHLVRSQRSSTGSINERRGSRTNRTASSPAGGINGVRSLARGNTTHEGITVNVFSPCTRVTLWRACCLISEEDSGIHTRESIRKHP